MQLSKRFLKVIADRFIVTPRRMKALSEIEPDRIYVENIRAVLGGTSWMAKLICETAVRQGIFAKKIQILCPEGGATTIDYGEEIPPTIPCQKDIDGTLERINEPTNRLDKLEFYEYIRGTA
jgi:hypothetical protein